MRTQKTTGWEQCVSILFWATRGLVSLVTVKIPTLNMIHQCEHSHVSTKMQFSVPVNKVLVHRKIQRREVFFPHICGRSTTKDKQ